MKNLFNLFCFIFIFIVSIVNAQWPTTIEDDLVVNNNANSPFSTLEDGSGGFYIAYGISDYKDTVWTNYLWLQHINKLGEQVFEAKKIADRQEYYTESKTVQSSDGHLLIGMLENDFLYRDDEYHYFTKTILQKLDKLGNKVWGNGVNITKDSLNQIAFEIFPTIEGGCFASNVNIDYNTSPPTGYKSIQKINANGEREWGDSGKVVYIGRLSNGTEYESPKLFLNDTNGVLVVNILNNDNNKSVMKLNNEGETIWEVVPRVNHNFINEYQDGTGGVYLFYNSWLDGYVGLKFFVDRIDRFGNYQFENPIEFIDSADIDSELASLEISNDTTLNILWRDSDGSGTYRTFFQRIDKEGHLIFNQREIEPLPANTYSYDVLLTDSSFIALTELGTVVRFDFNGKQIWGDTGITFANIPEGCFALPHLISNGSGGCIVSWQKCVLGVRAKMINKYGELGIIIDGIQKSEDISHSYFVSQNYPNPFNSSTTIQYYLPNSSDVNITIVDLLGQMVYEHKESNKSTGRYNLHINADRLSTGVYFIYYQFIDSHTKNKLHEVAKKLLLLK